MKKFNNTIKLTGIFLVVMTLFFSCKKNSPPVLDLGGAGDTTICLGALYNPIVASALDAYGDKIDVITNGSVDASTLGSYIIEFIATDKNDNVISQQIVIAVELCVSSLMGEYTVSHDCTIAGQSIISDNQSILAGITDNDFIIDNFNSVLSQVYATVSENDVTIAETSFSIPYTYMGQTITSTVALSGQGTVSSTGEITIDYTYTVTGDIPVAGPTELTSGTCTATYSK